MRIVSNCLLSLLFIHGSLNAQQNLSITPLKAQPGNVIQIEYLPAGDIANTPGKVEAVVYLSGSKGRSAYDLLLTKKGKKYLATIQTDTSHNFIQLGFYVDSKYDNNFNDGYFIQLYDGEKIRRESNLDLGLFYMYYGGETKVDASTEKAISAMDNELALYPEQKRKVALYYYGLLRKLKSNEVQPKIQADIETLLKEGLKIESDYDYLVTLYNAAQLQQQAQFIEALRKEKYPQGKWVIHDFVKQYMEERDPAKKATMFAAIESNIQANSDWDGYKNAMPYFRSSMIEAYAAQNDWETFKKLTSTLKDKNDIASIYNNAAWGLQEKNENLKMAEEFSYFATEQASVERKKPTSTKPDYLTAKQWTQQREDTYAMNADTYAMVLYKLGEYKKGFVYGNEIAFAIKKGTDLHANDTYALLAQKVLPSKTLKPQLEKMVMEGTGGAGVKEALRAIYLDDKKAESGFDQYMADLGKEMNIKMVEEIKKSIIKKAAPSFSLLDSNGQSVNLADLKGKIVVVDFWATWCGPCKAAFPGMQQMADKYKSNPNIKFLFINTWERGENKEKKVNDFAAEHRYTFQILMDNENKTVEAYDVKGIPTKFVIDKNGDIRFQSSGFNGSDDKLMNELTTMIELASSE